MVMMMKLVMMMTMMIDDLQQKTTKWTGCPLPRNKDGCFLDVLHGRHVPRAACQETAHQVVWFRTSTLNQTPSG